MKYSIFHTSRCGSTLLACLLSKSIQTLAEPSWSCQPTENIDFEKNHKEECLVKYPSMAYQLIPNIDSKIVFLYRNLDDHLKKLESVREINRQEEAFLWSSRFFFATQAEDIIFIESNYFLNNQKETCQLICDYFGIEYKPVEINFHVKDAGFNGKDNLINLGDN
jgi:hypothetical protein